MSDDWTVIDSQRKKNDVSARSLLLSLTFEFLKIAGHQSGRLDRHHVLRSRRPFLLGLGLLRPAHCGESGNLFTSHPLSSLKAKYAQVATIIIIIHLYSAFYIKWSKAL